MKICINTKGDKILSLKIIRFSMFDLLSLYMNPSFIYIYMNTAYYVYI